MELLNLTQRLQRVEEFLGTLMEPFLGAILLGWGIVQFLKLNYGLLSMGLDWLRTEDFLRSMSNRIL